MRKIFFISSILLLLLLSVKATQAKVKLPIDIQLSDSSYISLLTCDPGNALYSAFGHSAVRVVDYKKHFDIVFNYGTFSFNTPNFYLKFAAGKLNYKLSISNYNRFLHSYKYEKRQVLEQKLNLNKQEKRDVFQALVVNSQPENCEYMYDFFFDNCATRILDILEDNLKDSLIYGPIEINENLTFRNLIDECLIQGSWSDVGIDIALGSAIDSKASLREQTFLPDYLSRYMSHCSIGSKPLVSETNIILPDETNFMPTLFILRPVFVFWFAFFVILIASIVLRSKPWVIADRLIFSTVGLVGIIAILMWVATDHAAANGNINFIWANPLYIVYALLLKGERNKIIRISSPIFLFVNLIVLLAWNHFPQEFNYIFIPIIGFTSIRLIVHSIQNLKKQ